MSSVLLTNTRQQSPSVHPPETEDRQILRIPDRARLQRLSLADRLTFRLGLRLLERSTRLHPPAHPRGHGLDRRTIRESEATALLAWGLPRNIL